MFCRAMEIGLLGSRKAYALYIGLVVANVNNHFLSIVVDLGFYRGVWVLIDWFASH